MKPYAFVLSLSFLLSAPLAAVELPGPVVSPQWLDQNRDAVVVLDVRNGLDAFTEKPEYETAADGTKKLTYVGGHVAGARPVDFNTLRVSTTVDGKKVTSPDNPTLSMPANPAAKMVLAFVDRSTPKSTIFASRADLDACVDRWGLATTPLAPFHTACNYR